MAGVSNADSCEAISSSSTIGLVVFLAWSRLVFRLAPIFIDLHNRSIICLFYSLIIPRLSTIKGLLGLAFARNCYRSPVTIIDRPRLLSIARDCYRSQSRQPSVNNDNHLVVG